MGILCWTLSKGTLCCMFRWCTSRRAVGLIIFLVCSVYFCFNYITGSPFYKPYLFDNNFGINRGNYSEKTDTAHVVKLAMTIQPLGRLGNLMGQYAVLYSLSRLNGYQAVLMPEMDILRNYFSLSLPTLNPAVAKVLPWKHHHLTDWMEPEYKEFSDVFAKLTGYLNSWTFYDHIRDEICREFTFLPSIMEEVQDFLSKAKGSKTSVTFIGVHVRRGDYLNLMLNLYDGVLADRTYMSAAMDHYRSQYADCLFVVSSDDLQWCKNNIDMHRGDVLLAWNGAKSNPGDDMALLSQCNHSIMTIGTYGYWASYLARGDVIYLSNFTNPELSVNKYLGRSNVLLPHWKGIPADLNSTSWL